MSSPSTTIIFRKDGDKFLETPKCIYRHLGASDNTNVLSILAFYDDGRYLANLPTQEKRYLGIACFAKAVCEESRGLQDIVDRFSPRLYGLADAVFMQDGTNKYAGVIVNMEHIGNTDEFAKAFQKYGRFGDKTFIVPIDEYLVATTAFIANDDSYSETLRENIHNEVEMVKNFVKRENIQLLTEAEYDKITNIIYDKTILNPFNNDENITKNVGIYNALCKKYKADYQNNSFPMDEELLKSLDKEHKIRTNR